MLLRIPARAVVASTVVVVVLLVVSTCSLLIGDYTMTLGDTLAAVVGRGDDGLGIYYVQEMRAPRVTAAILVGIALGVAGSIFQNVTGNPLGSPDIIGFTTGAATGALVQILLLGGDTDAVSLGALVGGFGTAAVVLGLTRRSGLTGNRLVLVGIGVGAVLAAVNSLLIVRASLSAAQTAAQWTAGSLNAVLWPRTVLLAIFVALLLVPAALLARPLGMLALGDDLASGAGVRVRRVRNGSVVVAVALVSVAIAVTGPLAFVALAAPQVARRLGGLATPGMASSGLVGALLVVTSDLVGQQLFAPTELAVGVVTGAVGGIYLVLLLAGEWRKQHG
ncbi:hypothetical protein ASE01_08930 [Nocardioides sp. Root190]|nr:hypothetical protein ASE01_08930 [Nocardioides sp. Root190]